MTRLAAAGTLAAALIAADAPLPAGGSPSLIEAAHRNDLRLVLRLLAAHADVKATNSYGVTALSEAAAQGNPRMVEALLRAGADANTIGPEGQTALMAASRSGSVPAVQSLLRQGARVDSREGWKGQTALMWAAAANHAEVAQALIRAGADVDARSTAWPVKPKKKEDGNLVSTPPRGGLTPLHFAARQGALSAARVLVEAGAKLDLAEPDGMSATVIAIINGHYDLAQWLLEAGADPNVADKWGRAALYAAVDMNTLEPSVTRPAPKTSNDHTALDVAWAALQHGAKVDAALIEPTPGRGVSDFADPILIAGVTPFFRAAKTGDVAAMHLLLQNGANPHTRSAQKVTALMAAAGLGWRYGDSEVPEAAGLAAAKLCLELGLDVNASDEKGRTAMHGAAERGATLLAEFLAAHGAALNAKDGAGQTPLDVAKGNGGRGNPEYPSTVNVLLKLDREAQ
jgi:uncharacterized protein